MLKNKKHTNDKRLLIVVFVFLLFGFMIFTVTQNRNYSKIEKVVRDIGVEIENFFIPKTKEYSNHLIKGINWELEEENRELKEILKLDDRKYFLIHADVVKREIDWYQEITINKGEKDGVGVDMAVVSNQGLIGRISKTGYSSSVVKLLTANSNDMKVAVNIKSENTVIHGIIDDYLENESLIQVNNISKSQEIKLDDMVYTNGLGGIYPSGIYIGKVVEVATDSLGLNKIVKVKPDVSYDILRYVTVIGRGKTE